MKGTPRADGHYTEVATMPPCFRRLFDHAVDERRIGVLLHKGDRNGHFVTEHVIDGHDPHIDLLVPGRIDQIDDELDTINLAHELGHHESWLRRDASEEAEDLFAFRSDTAKADPESEPLGLRQEWVAEELRAWRYGREILALVVPEFDAWTAFDREAISHVRSYAEGLRTSKVDGS